MDNIAPKPSKRLQWIDIAKGIGIILVVIGHCAPPQHIKTIIFSFHMPLFFFLSGLVYRNKSNALSNNYGTRLKKDFIRLILPYIATAILVGIFLTINQSLGRWCFYDSTESLFKAAVFGSGADYRGIQLIGEIWFLLAMFWTRRIMDTVFLCPKTIYRSAVVMLFVGCGIALAASNLWAPFSIDIAFVAVGFMFAGWLVQQKQEVIDNPAMICVLIMIAIVTLFTSKFEMANRGYSVAWYISIPGAIALSMLTCKISKLIEKVKGLRSALAYIGKHSLLFICVHSLDWRLPFPQPGHTIVESFTGSEWYWAVGSIHRFLFDLIVTIIIASGLALCKRLYSKIRKQ